MIKPVASLLIAIVVIHYLSIPFGPPALMNYIGNALNFGIAGVSVVVGGWKKGEIFLGREVELGAWGFEERGMVFKRWAWGL